MLGDFAETTVAVSQDVEPHFKNGKAVNSSIPWRKAVDLITDRYADKISRGE